MDVSRQLYGMPTIWLTATSGEWIGMLRLVVAPVEDPVGDNRVNIVVPHAPQPVSASVVDAPAVSINPSSGMLTGTVSLPGHGEYFVTADWTTDGKPNHLVQSMDTPLPVAPPLK